MICAITNDALAHAQQLSRRRSIGGQRERLKRHIDRFAWRRTGALGDHHAGAAHIASVLVHLPVWAASINPSTPALFNSGATGPATDVILHLLDPVSNFNDTVG